MRRLVIALTALLLTPALLALPGASPSVASAASTGLPYSVQTLYFSVDVGPDNSRPCSIIGDLYLPKSASTTNRVPAVLTTNGFGGSKDDQAGIGEGLASRGYAVLSYSGLGFGGSGCKITLDDPDWDGKAAQQLVSYLGGRDGIAYRNAGHTDPAPKLTVIKRDRRDHHGRRSSNDPRVGMIGGSYGGAVQFAAASQDARIDALVPLITWNDLSYSMAPNAATSLGTVSSGVTNPVPGAAKVVWSLGFAALGMATGLENAAQDPARLVGCPNFADFVCPALIHGVATGYLPPSAIDSLRHASPATVLDEVRVPTLLMQGQADTLFNLNEAVATYESLRRQHTPVKMIWQSWGHSDGTPAPGEIDLGALDPDAQYLTGRAISWFERHLKDRKVATGPRFSYFRPWVDYSGNASPAYATSDSFPVGDRRTWFFSGRDDLRRTGEAELGAQRFVTPPAGLPTSLDKVDVLGSFFGEENALTGQSLPGTSALWRTRALDKPLHVAGIPKAEIQLRSLTGAITGRLGPAGKVVLFLKVVDIAPDGTRRMIKDTIAPVRVPDVRQPFQVDLPGIVHEFDAGHRVGLEIAAGSPNYRGNLLPATVRIGSSTSNTLSLPVVRP